LKTRDSQIQYIRLNGVRIAACAWNGHRGKGRGLLCVLSDTSKTTPTEESRTFRGFRHHFKIMPPIHSTGRATNAAFMAELRDSVLMAKKEITDARQRLDTAFEALRQSNLALQKALDSN